MCADGNSQATTRRFSRLSICSTLRIFVENSKGASGGSISGKVIEIGSFLDQRFALDHR
jgi:hypothetical protein